MADITKEYLALRDQYIESRFARLNPVQRQAVFATEGPLLILAGAGSGKTTVLVNRIANIIRFGSAHGSTELPRPVTEADLNDLRNAVAAGRDLPRETAYLAVRPARPWNVLAITFTNKAAGELKERLRAMLGETLGGDVNASTFHSACVRMLRRDAERIGFPKSFTIYDSDDQQRVIKQIYKDLMIDDKFLPVKSAIGQISSFKDKLLSAEDVAGEPFANTKAQLVSKIYTAYAGRLKAAGAMDFDDLIFHTVKLLQNDAEAREYYQNRFRYVVVDEYQDTSIAQFHLVRLLAGGTNNVCVVGDDDQSIYKFRGATIENILNFEKVFTGAKTIRLEQNYRSTANILNAANSVIKNNMGRKGKTLWTDHGDGEKVHHYTATNEQDEASHIADVIGEHLREGASLKDHAVLYRMNAQSNPIETYFARAGIPYRIVGGQRFFDRKEVKDINSYLAVIVNPRDDVRLRRIINEPARKIGMTTIEKIGELAASKGVPMMEIIAHVRDYPELQRAAAALERFYEMYRELCDLSVSEPLDQFVGDVIAKSGYEAMLKAMKEEGETRRENLGQLVSSIKTYADQNGEDATLSGFLEEVALISDLDSYDNDADSVTMMTIHSAKGLEFPYVFVVGMEDGIFPGEMAKYNEEDMEEERRLCYVAITRAKKELYLSTSRTRMIFGQTRRNPPSAFLSEIDPGLLDETQSPELTGYGGGFGAGYGSYSTNVPGGRSGYSGASRGYLNSEYNARPPRRVWRRLQQRLCQRRPRKPQLLRRTPSSAEHGLWLGLRTQPQRGQHGPRGRGHIHAGRCAVRCPSEEGDCRQLRGGGHCRAPRVWPRQGAEGHADCGGLHCRDSV
ncbi:MAG: ATP-dependent helicase [Gemmiger formicilis]|uniref:ATP-dependent helicase n=2 Tax=Gemmiger formicilis TaxID=745368 RepID=UPI0039916E00